MLDQNSQRILANATDILYHDFEPRDCVCFFQSKGILTDDDVEEIISCVSKNIFKIKVFFFFIE